MTAETRNRWLPAWAVVLCVATLLATAVPAGSDPVPAGPQLSLVFVRPTARVVGSQALILVRCLGSQRAVCSGTVSVSVAHRRHRAPFSVGGGSRESLAVPVGSRRAVGVLGRAVASTAQPSGGYVRIRETLRLR
jgi:hypothetical protein